jgi:predicted nucleotidyltransferase
LAQGLSDLLNRKVDLIPEHELNPHIKAQVLAEAVAL